MAKNLRDAVRQLGHVFADDIDIEEMMTTIEDTLKASWKTVDDEDTAEHKDISLELRQPSVSFEKAYYWSYKGRVLFRIKGNLIGLSPQSTLPGDQVFMLRNAHVPFILRTVSSGAYELVGEAYVHGLMEGQATHEATGQMSKIEIV
ncbi:C4-dicarboxylate transporter/malic acid transport protein [Neofusicoccum parvum]|uniref:C4-dicarboxylate transporter/malic acid transport protein n=1 Tax=Neofusicoccum parvum TaxID=310453 RepID=A0ACB5SQJ7_9PEZI|nr:C4-dicarboxylate transporter/malic acid transport protein [Neofusicoccum parvum]